MPFAIILAAHGSLRADVQAATDALAGRVRTAHPDARVALASTSAHVRRRLAEQGRDADGPAEALDRLAAEGHRRVVLQSLHIAPGEEYHNLLELARRRTEAGQFDRIEVGFPLLGGEPGLDRAAGALLAALPKPEAGEAVVLMGHGTAHPGRAFYTGLDEKLRASGARVVLGVMEEEPGSGLGLDDVLARLAADGVTRAVLVPLLFGAGFHAQVDMAGDAPGSWKSRLEDAGIAVRTVLRGVGQHEALADVWLEHLAEAAARLERD